MQDTQKEFYKKDFGSLGEKLAVKHLKKKGYKILEKNYTNLIGEVDIIAKKNGFICFVEVKTRSSDLYGLPREAVGFAKQQKYRRMANLYMIANNLTDKPIMFIVVDILKDQVTIIENAF